MSKFYKLFFPPPYSGNFAFQSQKLSEALNEMRAYQNKDMWHSAFRGEHDRRRAPGKVRRINAKEKSRQKDRERIKEIISIILSEKQVMGPPETLKAFKAIQKK